MFTCLEKKLAEKKAASGVVVQGEAYMSALFSLGCLGLSTA